MEFIRELTTPKSRLGFSYNNVCDCVRLTLKIYSFYIKNHKNCIHKYCFDKTNHS
jgi:hypothetical protein